MDTQINQEQLLLQIILRVPKEHSAFTYFTLEAHEGLCMYSTITSGLGQPYRDLNLVGVVEFKEQILHLIGQLQKRFPLQILEQKIITDGPLPHKDHLGE